MNIFYLHKHPVLCARYHNDKHVVKMILETTQLLYTCLWLCLDNWQDDAPLTLSGNKGYKKTHVNHPSGIWTRESLSNYKWLCKLGIELCKEYTHRYNKIHACEKHLYWLSKQIPNITDIGLTNIKLAMPDKYKCNDLVLSYRNYYIHEKSSFSKWTNRKISWWFKKPENI